MQLLVPLCSSPDAAEQILRQARFDKTRLASSLSLLSSLLLNPFLRMALRLPVLQLVPLVFRDHVPL